MTKTPYHKIWRQNYTLKKATVSAQKLKNVTSNALNYVCKSVTHVLC